MPESDRTVHALTAAAHLLEAAAHKVMCGMDSVPEWDLAWETLAFIADNEERRACLGKEP